MKGKTLDLGTVILGNKEMRVLLSIYKSRPCWVPSSVLAERHKTTVNNIHQIVYRIRTKLGRGIVESRYRGYRWKL